MGKKSRRNRNKKTGNDAASTTASASATASAIASATASASTIAANDAAANGAGAGTNQCFHGSTAGKSQPNGEYMKAAAEYVEMLRQESLLDYQDSSKKQQALAIRSIIYKEHHMHLIKDPEFHRFLFAFCTKQYLASDIFKDPLRRQVVHDLLLFGLMCRYGTTSKELTKYNRDIRTDRGLIKVLVRETRTHCKCMNEGKVIAKTMDKTGKCDGCKEDFPKLTLRICNGCQYVRYHDSDCQRNHWLEHHQFDCQSFARANAKEANAKEH